MSIELPDGKVCRNLPEQVAKNAKDIKAIGEILDGLNIQDNVVAIADMSQILTRDELDIVERPVAFLYYSGQLYIKKNEVGGSAFFDVIFTITGSTVLSFNSKEIEVVLNTGALILTTSTVSTYSKSEIDSLLSAKSDITYVDNKLALKANLAGANFTGAITAPSIIEDMSGYNITQITKSNVTKEDIYGGIVKNGNKLTIVIALNITRTDTAPTGSDYQITVPASVGAKLIPTLIGGADTLAVASLQCSVNSYSLPTSIPCSVFKNSDTDVRIAFWGLSSLTVNTTYYARIEVTFLLSDSLLS